MQMLLDPSTVPEVIKQAAVSGKDIVQPVFPTLETGAVDSTIIEESTCCRVPRD